MNKKKDTYQTARKPILAYNSTKVTVKVIAFWVKYPKKKKVEILLQI